MSAFSGLEGDVLAPDIDMEGAEKVLNEETTLRGGEAGGVTSGFDSARGGTGGA